MTTSKGNRRKKVRILLHWSVTGRDKSVAKQVLIRFGEESEKLFGEALVREHFSESSKQENIEHSLRCNTEECQARIR